MANSAGPDQLASSEANWSGSTLFTKAGYIRVQQDTEINVCVEVLPSQPNGFMSSAISLPNHNLTGQA